MIEHPPGPTPLQALAFVRNPLKFFARTAAEHGPISYFRVLGQRIYLIDDPELIQEVLVARQHEFHRDTGATLLRELVGDGLLTRDEPAHKERRRALQPAFHRAQVASYAGVMSAECARHIAAWRRGERLDMAVEMKRLTLSIVGASLFGTDFSASANSIAAVLNRVIASGRWIGPILPLVEPLLRARPEGRGIFFRSERRRLDRILQPVIARRRAAQSTDILSLLLDQLDDRAAANEIVTLVLAGHETTATALTWAWHLIAAHPAVEQRLHNELHAVLGRRMPAFEDLPHLTYTAMVFNEAMRLYPPAPAFGRRPKHDIDLLGYPIPAGSSIFLSPYVTHRNPLYWERPESFDPSRWRDIQIPKFAYFPFGGGANMCIGDTFARMEGVLVLASVAQQWRLVPDDPSPLGFHLGVTLRPDRPLWMRPEPVA
jgi:cytochrome P450